MQFLDSENAQHSLEIAQIPGLHITHTTEELALSLTHITRGLKLLASSLCYLAVITLLCSALPR